SLSSNGKLNEEKVRELVRLQIENGTDGIVPCGTTGESPALTTEEKNQLIKIVVEEARGKAKVIAGTGTNNTEKSVQATARAKEMGADAALVITPYYNKPTQAGLVRHFEAVAEVNLPIMIYNVPGRTAVNMLPATVGELSKLDQIVAIKEASGDLNQVSEIITTCKERIQVLSGDDSLLAPILSVGGVGVVSVVANIVPKDLKSLFDAFKSNEVKRMQQLHHQLFGLCQAMFYETNPIPVKTAMNLMGMDVGDLRSPLAPMSDIHKQKLVETLKAYGLLK
ncbi:MAG: 4-hydroxy-tetrahydrodipicolinate synthase, partial [bacterium]